MDGFRAEFATLRSGWQGRASNAYDGWVARANNAAFGAQAAYDDLVPGFEALFEREGRDWPRFYAEVRRIAALPTTQERRSALQTATGILQTHSSEDNNNGDHGA
jgi:predicted aminopeptidase